MKTSFAISGMGRSGTRFLATMMNRSPTWTVEHEPWPRYHLQDQIDTIQQRFNRDHYGEVNSFLRYILVDLRLKKKGIIRRNPADIFLSVCNWEPDFLPDFSNRMIELRKAFAAVDRALKDPKIHPIVFEHLVSDPDYTNEVIKKFGIDNVHIDGDDLRKKINRSKATRYRCFKDLNVGHVLAFRRDLAWFSEKYGYPIP